jgi:hypothetical protein
MKVEKKGNTIILKDTQDDLASFILKITTEYKKFVAYNIIANISKYESLIAKNIETFLPLSKTHKKSKKSFIIVASNIDFNAVSDKLAVVRSLQEAYDIIKMEEIERDLGF